MIARVGDTQRRNAIVNHNLNRPFLFITFDEKKEPVIINHKVTSVMFDNFKTKLKMLEDSLRRTAEDGASNYKEVKVL